MGNIGPVQLLIVLVIVLLLFGSKKLKTLGSDLGGALRGFKKSMKDDEPEPRLEADEPVTAQTQEKQSAKSD